MLEDVAVRGVLTVSSFLGRMFQCVNCEFSQSRSDEVVQHFLKEHLKPSEVPFVCDQCQFRAHTRQVMVDHRRGKHQALQGEDLDNIYYGSLKPIREEIFKLLPVLHRPEAEGAERSKGPRRVADPETIAGPLMVSGTEGTGTGVGPRCTCKKLRSSEGALPKEKEEESSCATKWCR